MRILGIDLAAQPENTGACVVEWLPDRARREGWIHVPTAGLDVLGP